MVKVIQVERVNEIDITDGYYRIVFRYDRETGGLKAVFRGVNRSRMHEPAYIPKDVYAEFVRKAYAIFYDTKRKKVEKSNVKQLSLNL